jgi:hypothetical protein
VTGLRRHETTTGAWVWDFGADRSVEATLLLDVGPGESLQTFLDQHWFRGERMTVATINLLLGLGLELIGLFKNERDRWVESGGDPSELPSDAELITLMESKADALVSRAQALRDKIKGTAPDDSPESD